jgi:hypothetical protein
MSNVPDGQASASDFDFYEDVDSEHPIPANQAGATPSLILAPSLTLAQHPRLQQLRGAVPTRNSTRLAVTAKRARKPSKKLTPSNKKIKTGTARKPPHKVTVLDSDEDEDEDDEIGSDEEEDEKTLGERLEDLESLSVMDSSVSFQNEA